MELSKKGRKERERIRREEAQAENDAKSKNQNGGNGRPMERAMGATKEVDDGALMRL